MLQVAGEFGVTVGTVGISAAAYSVPAALVAFSAGPLSDRHGRKRFIVGGSLLIGVGMIAVALAPGFEGFLLGRAVGGAGLALSVSTLYALLADRFPYRERGKAVAVVIGATTVVDIFGIPLLGIVGEAAGWRPALGLVGVLALMAAAFAFFRLQAVPATALTETARGLYARVLGHAAVRQLMVTGLLVTLTFTGWYTYSVAYFQTVFGLGQGIAATLTATAGVGILIGSQLGGRIGDRLGHRATLGAALPTIGIVLALLTNLPVSLAIALVLNGLAAAGVGVVAVAHRSLVSEQIPEARGTLLSILGGLMLLGGLGATIGGFLIDLAGFWLLGLYCLATTLAGRVLLLGVPEGPMERRAEA